MCGSQAQGPAWRREAAFTLDDAIRIGRDAGDELKKTAGPDFFSW